MDRLDRGKLQAGGQRLPHHFATLAVRPGASCGMSQGVDYNREGTVVWLALS